MESPISPGRRVDKAIEDGWKKQVLKVIAHVDLDAFYSQVGLSTSCSPTLWPSQGFQQSVDVVDDAFHVSNLQSGPRLLHACMHASTSSSACPKIWEMNNS